MDLQAFIDRISNAELLLPEDRQYFLDHAAEYTPEARQNMVDVLTQQEDEFLAFAENASEEAHKALLEQLAKMMQDHESFHKKEIAQAEETLEKDLNALS